MSRQTWTTSRVSAGSVAGVYAAAGAAWILVSTVLGARSSSAVDDMAYIEVLKGLAFVLATAALLFLLLRREFGRREEILASLAEEEERLREAESVARVGSWTMDPESPRVRWSDETCRILGTDPSTFPSSLAGYVQLVHAGDRDRVREALATVGIEKSEGGVIEHRIVRPDGEVLEIELRWRRRPGRIGSGWRIVGTCRDMTAQRRAEAGLGESRRMLREIIDSVQVRIFWKDRDLRYLGCNASFARDAGLESAEEIVGKDDFQLAWRDQAELYRADDRRVIDSGEPRLLIEEPQTQPSGETITLLTSKSPLRDGAGGIIGMIGSYMDISARKEAERSRALLASAVENAAEAVLITDPAGSIVYVNPAFERTTGYSSGEVVGSNPRILKSGRHDEAFYRDMWTTIRSGEVWRGRIINRRKNGDLLEEDVAITAVRDADGRIENFVAVRHDRTKLDLLERQLLQAQKMEAVGRLAGGVAHDFNNLLTLITGYSEMLLESVPAGDATHGWLSEINRAGHRAGALTRQLLIFSRRQVVEPTVLDINASVAGVEKMLRRLIGEDVALEVVPHPEPVPVRADPGHLEQVLMNLAVNARDAMPRGGVLTIATGSVELDEARCRELGGHGAGRYAVIGVRDTGTGMDEATLARIFEPFFTTKEVGRGTGLGLATVHGIVHEAGGFIAVRSEPGKGTSFDIHLPRAEGEASGKDAAGTTAALPRGHETILFVEDDEAVRRLGVHVLGGCGYRVLEAADGVHAVELARHYTQEIHLLLTDVVMPRMGGRELSEWILTARPDCRVLFVSGYTDDALILHGVQRAEMDLLPKPFTGAVLANKVREILDRAEGP